MRWYLSLVLVVACSKPAPSSTDAAPPASSSVVHHASPAPPPRDAPAPKRPQNLLQVVPAKIAVSSVVDNRTSKRRHGHGWRTRITNESELVIDEPAQP